MERSKPERKESFALLGFWVFLKSQENSCTRFFDLGWLEMHFVLLTLHTNKHICSYLLLYAHVSKKKKITFFMLVLDVLPGRIWTSLLSQLCLHYISVMLMNTAGWRR
jgi:hypothetical protein